MINKINKGKLGKQLNKSRVNQQDWETMRVIVRSRGTMKLKKILKHDLFYLYIPIFLKHL